MSDLGVWAVEIAKKLCLGCSTEYSDPRDYARFLLIWAQIEAFAFPLRSGNIRIPIFATKKQNGCEREGENQVMEWLPAFINIQRITTLEEMVGGSRLELETPCV